MSKKCPKQPGFLSGVVGETGPDADFEFLLFRLAGEAGLGFSVIFGRQSVDIRWALRRMIATRVHNDPLVARLICLCCRQSESQGNQIENAIVVSPLQCSQL
jgi:hypothetical protein